MKLDTLRKWIGWFKNRSLLVRYMAIVVVVYAPGVVVSLACGVFRGGGSHEREIYFITHYSFHYAYLFIVPASLLFLPPVHQRMETVLESLRSARPPIIHEGEQTNGWRRLSFCLLGVALACVVVPSQLFLSYLSNLSRGRGQFMWYYPSEGNYLPFIYSLFTETVVTSVFFVSLVRYLYTMRVIRKGVLSASELPTWVASSEGPVDRLFRSVFLLFLPMSTVAIAIVANRWVRQTGPLDFGMLYSVAMIPIGIILLLIGPIVYSGIPHKMLQQRSEALRPVDEKILEALEELSRQSDEAEDQRLVDRLHALGAKKSLILKNYPTFPIGSITRIISAFPISISALPALLSALAKLA